MKTARHLRGVSKLTLSNNQVGRFNAKSAKVAAKVAKEGLLCVPLRRPLRPLRSNHLYRSAFHPPTSRIHPTLIFKIHFVRYTLDLGMPSLELFKEIIATYQRHGWELKRVLIKPATRSDLTELAAGLFNEAGLIEAEIDALWFARPSHAGREAWELRLVAEQPYALLEAFESDEGEEEREEARLEMEHQMREQVAGT